MLGAVARPAEGGVLHPTTNGARPRRLDGSWWAALAIAVAYLIFTTVGALQVGTSWDENEHRRYGELALDFYTSFGAKSAATTDVMRYYGALHALVGAATERLFSFLYWPGARHLATVAFGLVGLVYCIRLARLLGGPRAGIVAALLLAATPRWTGDALYNPIDIPTAGMYAAALFYLARIAGAPHTAALRDWILFGVTAGMTLAVRMVGLLLLPYAALALGTWALFAPRPRLDVLREHAPRIVARLALAVAVALATACAFWPRMLVEPYTTLVETLAKTQSFHWDGLVFFRGKYVSALALPASYLPVWFGITTPLATMLGLVLAAACAWRIERDSRLRAGLVVFAVLFPPAYAIATHATIYDGIRHFLFVLPPLCALAAAGWAGALRFAAGRGRKLGLALALGLVGLVAEPLVWYARSHPYEYVYFNPLAGGLARASHAYEAEYWGISLRSAAEWLAGCRVRAGVLERPFVVGTNAPWHLLEPWLDDPKAYRFVETNRPADVRTAALDVLLLNHRFLGFRLEPPQVPLFALSLEQGQVPFFEIYPGPLLGRATKEGLVPPPR